MSNHSQLFVGLGIYLTTLFYGTFYKDDKLNIL